MTFKEREAFYLPILARAFAAKGLPPELGPAIARQESGFIARIDNQGPGDKERGGAWGLCQMTLKTAKALGWSGTLDELMEPLVNAALAADLCLDNAKRSSHPVASEAWFKDIAAMYNSGRVYEKAPRVTQMQYVPNIIRHLDTYRPLCEKFKVTK